MLKHSFFNSNLKERDDIMNTNIHVGMKSPVVKKDNLKNIKNHLNFLKKQREKEEKLPRILSSQFGDCFLSYLRLANKKEINLYDIEEYLEDVFIDDNYLRIMFDEVAPSFAITESISELSIIGGAEFSLENSAIARICFSRETALEMIQLRHPKHQKEIKKLVDNYLKRELSWEKGRKI